MSKSIKLHPKYGLNPTIPVCFWCGKEKNEIVMLGAAYKGEAPMRMALNYNPCPECECNMKRGFTLIEANTDKSGHPLPTGRWVVMEWKSAEKVFGHEKIRMGKAFMTPEVFSKVIKDSEVEE